MTTDLEAVLECYDAQLAGEVKGVQVVAANHQRVLGGVHAVDPPARNEERVPRLLAEAKRSWWCEETGAHVGSAAFSGVFTSSSRQVLSPLLPFHILPPPPFSSFVPRTHRELDAAKVFRAEVSEEAPLLRPRPPPKKLHVVLRGWAHPKDLGEVMGGEGKGRNAVMDREAGARKGIKLSRGS